MQLPGPQITCGYWFPILSSVCDCSASWNISSPSHSNWFGHFGSPAPTPGRCLFRGSCSGWRVRSRFRLCACTVALGFGGGGGRSRLASYCLCIESSALCRPASRTCRDSWCCRHLAPWSPRSCGRVSSAEVRRSCSISRWLLQGAPDTRVWSASCAASCSWLSVFDRQQVWCSDGVCYSCHLS